MGRIFYIVAFFLLNFHLYGQVKKDSTMLSHRDTVGTGIAADSLHSDSLRVDSLLVDSLKVDSLQADSLKWSGYNISPDAIDEEVQWSAKDMQHFDKDSNMLVLYKNAKVDYGTITLEGGIIRYDLDKGEVRSIKTVDTLKGEEEKAVFRDKKDEFYAEEIRYNIKTKKGFVRNAVKKEGELTVHGVKGKFISKEADTIHHVDNMFISKGLITNCTAEHPHWGIQANKIKLIPNKLAIFGVSTIELGDVPLYPLLLPFGMYPIFQGQKSGFILPKNLDYNVDFGVGVKDMGVYLILSDYMDMRITGDIYSRGTYGLHYESNYKKRYKYSGTFKFDYQNAVYEVVRDTVVETVHTPSYYFSLRHYQDPKAHPYQRLGGNINFSIGNYDRRARTDASSRLRNVISSNFNYTNSMPGTPFNLTVGLSQTQSNTTRNFVVDLPVVTLNMRPIHPFKRQKRIGKEKWYENIDLKYRFDAKNTIHATDTTIFTRQALDNMNYGLKQTLGSSARFRVMKYFNLTFSLNYNENHFFKIIDKRFDPTIIIDTLKDSQGNVLYDSDGNVRFDTTYGRVVVDTLDEWKVYRHITPSLSLSTTKYGKILFKKGWLRGLRHKIVYRFSLSGNPFDETKWWQKAVDTDVRDKYNKVEYYSIFSYSNPFGTARPQKANLIFNYSFNNLFEAKIFSKRDSSLKRISLIKNLIVSGSYNITADSFNFSPVSVSFGFSLFKNFVRVRYTGKWDPYMKVDGHRINSFYWNERKFPLRHDYSRVNISIFNVTFDKIINLFSKKENLNKKRTKNKGRQQEIESFAELFKDFRLDYNLNMVWEYNANNVDTFKVTTHSIRVSGTIPITKKWNIRVNNLDYDLKSKQFSYPDIGFSRDLHCWSMSFSWQPRGGTYSFFIGVKSSVLQFIKYQHGVDPLRAGLNRVSF